MMRFGGSQRRQPLGQGHPSCEEAAACLLAFAFTLTLQAEANQRVVQPATPVHETSARMLDARVHAAVLVDDGRVCGLVTAEQVSGAPAEGHDATETLVGVIGEQDPPVVGPDEPLAEVHERICSAGRVVVPVVADGQQRASVLEDLQ